MLEELPPTNPSSGEVNLLLVSTLMLAVSTVAFGILSIYAYSSNQHAQKVLKTAENTWFSQGQSAQKKTDATDAAAAAEVPFRNYKAPDLYGNFVVSFPKNWNAYVVEDEHANTQVNLILNPDLVKVLDPTKTNTYAFRALLINQQESTVFQNFQSRLKSIPKKLTQKDITVSGIPGIWLDGNFDDKHNGVVVLIPVRDKTLEFITDSHDHMTEFNQILAQSTVVK